jgi:hypothetical protein
VAVVAPELILQETRCRSTRRRYHRRRRDNRQSRRRRILRVILARRCHHHSVNRVHHHNRRSCQARCRMSYRSAGRTGPALPILPPIRVPDECLA